MSQSDLGPIQDFGYISMAIHDRVLANQFAPKSFNEYTDLVTTFIGQRGTVQAEKLASSFCYYLIKAVAACIPSVSNGKRIVVKGS